MTCARRETILSVGTLPQLGFPGEMLMVAPASEGIDLFKIAGRSISGWVPSLKTDTVIRQPFCSQLEERLLLWLEYHPLVTSYTRGDIGPQFATTYRLPLPQHAPFAIGYTFENKPHHYLPDVVGTLTSGKPFIAEAGMEDDKRGDRNLVKAEAARRLVYLQQGTFWIGTERTLTKRRHYNLVFLHARRKTFPAFADIAEALHSVWPWGEMSPVSEVASRLSHQFPVDLVEAAIWKVGQTARRRGICWSIWSSSRWIVSFPWACSHLMLRHKCPHPSLTRSCLNRIRRGWRPSHARRPPSFRVRRLMPLGFQGHNESSFTAICELWNKCWPGPPKAASRSRRASPVRRFRGW